MAKKSAGILLYNFSESNLRLLLVHPGGPYWAKKDRSAWSIPKGEFSDDEQPLEAAIREFKEEIGTDIDGEFEMLGEFRQPSGKIIFAWAIEGDFDVTKLESNTFTMEWPPKSGKQQEFPEVDRAEWYGPNIARQKILKGQIPIVDILLDKLNIDGPKEKYGDDVQQKLF